MVSNIRYMFNILRWKEGKKLSFFFYLCSRNQLIIKITKKEKMLVMKNRFFSFFMLVSFLMIVGVQYLLQKLTYNWEMVHIIAVEQC